MKSYICPSCKEEQTTVIQWQTISVASGFNLATKESEYDVDHEGGEHEAWTCPGCGEDLPNELCEKIEEVLWG